MTKSPYQVILAPIINEKSTRLKAENNQYCFTVERDSNKLEIKQAVEEIYKVDVESVNVIKVPRKRRRMGISQGYTSAKKKAVVKLKQGQTIGDFEVM